MLTRPPATARAARQRQYRARLRDGRMTARVEIDGAVVAMLCRLHWLDPSATGDRGAIDRALAAMLRDAAQK
jgi:hypothetical protein